VIIFKNTIIFFLFLFFSISLAQNTKTNIAVIDLDPTGISNNEAQFLSDRLRTELFETGVFQVVEREKMNAILNEQGFQQTGCTSVECAIEIGQLLNVQIMVAGGIGKIEELYSLSIRMIDVESGAIIRTATRDYEGKLSEVLTDVIPEVSAELAEAEHIESDISVKEDEPDITQEEQEFNRWGILLKLGISVLNYTNDINNAIKELDPATQELLDDFSNHSNFGFEVRYALSQRWKLKIGLGVENLFSAWKVSFNAVVLEQQVSFEFERDYQFVSTYIGVNFSLWQNPEVYDIYLGTDIGSTLLNSHVKTHLEGIAVDDTEETFEYSAFSWKFSLGGIYFLSSRFSLGLELGLKGGGKFDTSDQFGDENIDSSTGIAREVDSGGLQTVIFIGYHF
jgi:TolB-like protein